MSNDTPLVPRPFVPVVAAVIGFLVGVVLGDIGLGIVFATLAGFGAAVYTARRNRRS